MWLRCWRILALQTLILATGPAALAGETSTTLRVTARVVERCTFTARPIERVPEHARLRLADVVDARCDRGRPARLTIAPPARPVAIEQRPGDERRHLQITITY